METSHPYSSLTPDLIMEAVDSLGLLCDGRLLALNSYENRVYQVGIDEESPLIAKFYRPERWSREQILEEHAFTLEMAALDIPVVPPIIHDDQTLFHHAGFDFALYPRRGGHAPELDNLDNLVILGRHLGRIHRAGRQRPFGYRPTITIEDYGAHSHQFLLKSFIPEDLKEAYDTLCQDLLTRIRQIFHEVGAFQCLRLHGDCHAGNILWRDDLPNFVDFDDARMGPAIQDLWMMLSGDRMNQTLQLDALLEGYNEFAEFDFRELRLIESLRTLRLMHYNAWLGKRWDDPAFPKNFPWFNTPNFWSEHILELREQLALLDEPVLMLH
jgi:Ser/Thr protein kinase RdoA (MazF antagonist)